MIKLHEMMLPCNTLCANDIPVAEILGILKHENVQNLKMHQTF